MSRLIHNPVHFWVFINDNIQLQCLLFPPEQSQGTGTVGPPFGRIQHLIFVLCGTPPKHFSLILEVLLSIYLFFIYSSIYLPCICHLLLVCPNIYLYVANDLKENTTICGETYKIYIKNHWYSESFPSPPCIIVLHFQEGPESVRKKSAHLSMSTTPWFLNHPVLFFSNSSSSLTTNKDCIWCAFLTFAQMFF